MNTPIDDLKQDLCTDLNDYINDVSVGEKRIFDFMIPLKERVDALNKYYEECPHNIFEITKKLTAIYCMSPISIVKKYLYEVAKYSELPIEIKMDCAITLADIDISSELGFECMNLLYPFSQFPTVCQLDFIIKLLNTPTYCSVYKNRLINFLVYTDLPTEWRYKIILSIPHLLTLKTDETPIHFTLRVCKLFATNISTEISYKILACQYLLTSGQQDHINTAENLLTSFMNDIVLEHRLRADAADVLIHHGTKQKVIEASNVLQELGGKNVHLYENKENVHTKEIEDSVRLVVQYLNTLNLSPIPSLDVVSYNIKKLAQDKYRKITYEYTPVIHIGKKNKIEQVHTKKIVSDELHPNEEKIYSALTRIELDRTLFKDINHTLQSVFLLIYTFIQTNTFKKDLETRLLEELIDMAGTCTSGYLSRLVNVLSGYTEYNLNISWKDQIASNLSGRLNARLKQEKDMHIILEQMTNKSISDRSIFLKFFRENLLSIREEMYQEFHSYMDDLKWDEYFQQAVLLYDQT